MMRKIADELMAYCDLKEDIYYPYIPEKQRKEYMIEAMQIARKMAIHFQGQPIRNLLEAANVEVKSHQGNGPCGIHSQMTYDKERGYIDLYLGVLARCKTAMKKVGYDFSMEQLMTIHLAHEFYHYIEISQDKRTEEILPAVQYRYWGIFNRSVHIKATSEIAAHFFAKEICHFEIHPKVMDYVLLCEKEEHVEEKTMMLLEEIEEVYRREIR